MLKIKRCLIIPFIIISFFLILKSVSPQEVPPEIQRIIKEKGITPEQLKRAKEALQTETLKETRPEKEVPGKTIEEIEKRVKERKKKKEEIQIPKFMRDILESQKIIYQEKKRKEKIPKLKIFGHDLFLHPPSTFAPISAVPVSDDYVIGPGDEIRVLMWGRIDATYSLTVNNEGIINFPKIGPLAVAGLTYRELKSLIKKKAEAITGVNVHVSMGKLRSIQVFVLGEVKTPGVYTVSSLATAINALLTSGGPTTLGSLRRIQVKRKNRVITEIDLYDLLMQGDTSADIRLMPGDVIFVPQVGPLITIYGNVKRPAIYELKDKKTLKEAIRLAGGLSPMAYNQRIQVERFVKYQYKVVLDVGYEALERQKEINLKDGDLIRVFSIIPEDINAVYLYGNVLRPGKYSYKKGMKIKDLIPNIKALKMDTYLDYALIKRYRSKDMEYEIIPFNLRKALGGDIGHNLSLRPLDEVYIFDKWTFKDRPYAIVEGEVRNPGTYLIEKMRIRDLIKKAGDLTDEAYMEEAELIRIGKDQREKTIYFNVSKALKGDPGHNLLLQDRDRIIIHSVWDKRWKEYVYIDGEVKRPGEYRLTKGMRISDLLFKAGMFTRDAYRGEAHLYRTDPDTKEVTILTFNLDRALSDDPEHNILLKDQDKIAIHSIWEYLPKHIVTVTGEVNNPGDYPYAENMRVKDLLLVSGNIKESAYLDKAEILRFEIIKGKKVQTDLITVDLKEALKGDPSHNILLHPYDHLMVKRIPEWLEKPSIKITGEVKHPGIYFIKKGERLGSVLKRAGGFTEFAYLRGAVFTRRAAKKVQEKTIRTLIDRLKKETLVREVKESGAAISKEDLAITKQMLEAKKALISRLEKIKVTGRVVIKLSAIPLLERSKYNLTLEDGDTLYIPQRPSTVNVVGSVYNPSSFLYDPKHPEAGYYLDMAGGPTKNAEVDEIYIILADGSVVGRKGGRYLRIGWDPQDQRWAFMKGIRSYKLLPGDTVVVPEKIIVTTFRRLLLDWTEIIYKIAVAAGVTIALF